MHDRVKQILGLIKELDERERNKLASLVLELVVTKANDRKLVSHSKNSHGVCCPFCKSEKLDLMVYTEAGNAFIVAVAHAHSMN